MLGADQRIEFILRFEVKLRREIKLRVNVEAMGLNPVKAPRIFFHVKCCNCLNCKCSCDDHILFSESFKLIDVLSNNSYDWSFNPAW